MYIHILVQSRPITAYRKQKNTNILETISNFQEITIFIESSTNVDHSAKKTSSEQQKKQVLKCLDISHENNTNVIL